jgi:pimeloyl-ACP methyl ester carboxylesterase
MKSAKSVKDLANAMGEGNVTPGVLARATRFSQLDPEVMEFCLLEKMDEWLEEFDLDSFLSEITCPVFLMQADTVEMGQAMIDSDVSYAKSVISDVYHVKIEGFGHELGLEAWHVPRQVANEIISFLESIR